MAKRQRRAVKNTTLLVVGEGQHDKAFLAHMKGIYHHRKNNTKITLDFASGGSPYDVVNYTVKKNRHIDYDKRFILMDDDITIRQQDYDIAKRAGITILLSSPICLEGMLLTILDEYVSSSMSTAEKCKSVLHPQLSGNPIESRSYSPLFDKPILDKTEHDVIKELRKILSGKTK